MIETEVCIIGAGPAGLAAAIEAAKAGAHVTVIDENKFPGGQLFKQIHKFFGSREHMAGTRGFEIGEKLLAEAKEYGAEIRLRTIAYGFFEDNVIGIHDIDRRENGLIKAKKIIIATGAIENALPFKGWTTPGVMGAGAAQTLMNLYHLMPGKKVVMIGSGNVGLIVSYQLLQAGVEVVALVEAAPKITGYEVHARKLLRAGVPLYTSTTVSEVVGEKSVEKVVLVSLDEKFQKVKGTEMELEADTVCVAVGLSPLIDVVRMTECEFRYVKSLGGFLPAHDKNMETTKDGIYVAGDVSGIEEASSAMEEGRIAGIAAAESLGYLDTAMAEEKKAAYIDRLNQLRAGTFGAGRKKAKEMLMTGVNAHA